MTTLVTYSNDLMSIAAEICKASALNNNVNKVSHWKRQDIVKTKFYKTNKAILDSPRGDGFWCWKPFIIMEELKMMKDGEYLIYCDAGAEIVNNVNHIVDRMVYPVWLFGNKFAHAEWCKGDALEMICPRPFGSKWSLWLDGNCTQIRYRQCQASVMIFKAGPVARDFVNEWLKYCTMSGLIDDSPSKEKNYPTFSEHRHDQALATCLAIRDDIPLHWWPAMYNAGHFTYEKTGYTDNYPVLFHHHRMRNNDFSATDDLNRHMQKYFKSKYSFV